MYIGEHKLGCTITFNFQALDGDGFSIDPSNTPTFIVYESNEPMTPDVSGSLVKINDQTGFYGGELELSADNGFISGKTYTIRVSATVDGINTLKTYSFNVIASVPSVQVQNLVAGGSVSGVVSGYSTELDEEFVVLATEMIAEMGKTVVFRTYPDASYDAVEGVTTLGDMLSYTKKVMPPYAYKQKYIDGDVIQAGDMQTGIAGQGLEFTPEPGLIEIVIDEQTWNIVNMTPLYSGEQIAMFLLQLRK